ncbi:MAG: DUF3368 domain-containing protein [Bacteroidota bacterium]
MPEAGVIISDTSCLIVLRNIDELTLLQKVYSSIITTKEVADEFGDEFPDWILIKSPKDQQKQQLLSFQVDKGEASAIALAMELPTEAIILDDYKARQLAVKLGLPVTGTLGVLIKAKNQEIIPSVIPILEKLKQTNFRISNQLVEEVLEMAGEK